MSVRTADGLMVELGIVAQYTVVREKIPQIYQTYKTEYEGFFISNLRSALQSTVAEFKATELYTDRFKVSTALLATCKVVCHGNLQGFLACWGIQLLEVRLDQRIESANVRQQVEMQKQATEEMKQKASLIRAKTTVLEADFDRQVKLVNVEASAAAVNITRKAEADAAYNMQEARAEVLRTIQNTVKSGFAPLTNSELLKYMEQGALIESTAGPMIYGDFQSATVFTQTGGEKTPMDPFLQIQAPAVAPAAAPTKNLPKPAAQQVEAPAPEPAQSSTRSEGHDRRLAKLRAAVAMHRPSRTSEAAQVDDSDAKSESAFSARSDFSVQTAVIAQHSQSQQPQDAAGLKAALKTFIQDFVRGRELHMPSKNGLSGVVCKITKAVDALLVGDGARAVAFADVLQVHRGLEAMPLSLGHELDSNWVVLELSSGDCLSFHLGHAKGADDFTLFMRLLVSMRRQQQRAAKPPQVDDDAKSEVSVQSAIVQKTMNNSSVASIADDPKEVKKMYKMFVETMKRGRDFYILRPDGTLLDVDCSLTGSREVFRMRWDFQERPVPVADMKQVRTSKESSSLKLGLELDPRCATMELEGGECITFKFGHSEACDRFVICMRILIDQKRQCYRSVGFGGGGAPVQRLQKSSSSVSKQSGDSKAGPNATQVLIEEFVRVMMGGCEVAVLSKQGKQKVKLSLDADLTALSVKAKDGSRKDLLFSKVKAVHVGSAAEALQLGVVEVEWRLLSDFLAMDTANIMLAGLLSQMLTLRAGFPQGRKFSVHVFTALLKHFGEILLTQCSPSQTLLPDFAADAISGLWAALTPAPNDASLSGLGEQPSLQQIAMAVTQAPSPTEARRLAIHLLSRVHDRQQRAQCVEMMRSLALGPLLFVDDVVTPFATDRDVQHAVVHGLGAYSRFANAQFNMGPTKTAVLSCMDSPQTSLDALACESYKLLGVTIDSQLSFAKRAKQTVWAFARLTGTWPLSLLSESQPLEKLECCPFCNQGDVMIRHALCECSGTAALFVQTGLALHGTRRVDGDLLLQMLFHSTADSHIDAARIRYVGRALTATMDEYLQVVASVSGIAQPTLAPLPSILVRGSGLM
eukprot:s2775_g2.t1